MKRLALLLAAMTAGYSCGDLVIKVNKKSKSETASVDAAKAASLTDSEFFLDDVDDLRTAAVNTVVKYLQGEDFRNLVRDGFRDFHASLVSEAEKERDVSLMSLNTEELVCSEGKLDLNGHEAVGYLGLLLKSAVLAKIGDVNTQAFNSELVSEADAITTLILKEVGLNVDGSTTVANIDGKTVTVASVTLSLVPFETDDAVVQAGDEKRVIKLAFERSVGDKNIGTFNGQVAAVKPIGEGQTVTYVMNINADRSMNEQGFYTHQTRVEIGEDDKDANFVRQMTFVEQENSEVRVTDRITVADNTEMVTKVVNLAEIEQCVLKQVEVSDEDREKDADGEENSKSPVDPVIGEEEQSGKGEDVSDEENTDSPKEVVSIVDDGENMGGNEDPNQTPTQSADK